MVTDYLNLLKQCHIILSGSTGYIGSYIKNQLDSYGADYETFSCLTIESKPPKFSQSKFNIYWHLGESSTQPSNSFFVDTSNYLKAISYLKSTGIPIIYPSSVLADIMIDSNNAINPYSLRKTICESLLLERKNSVVLRLSGVINTNNLKPKTLISDIVLNTNIMRSYSPKKPDSIVNFIDVSDLLRALFHTTLMFLQPKKFKLSTHKNCFYVQSPASYSASFLANYYHSLIIGNSLSITPDPISYETQTYFQNLPGWSPDVTMLQLMQQIAKNRNE